MSSMKLHDRTLTFSSSTAHDTAERAGRRVLGAVLAINHTSTAPLSTIPARTSLSTSLTASSSTTASCIWALPAHGAL
eukprot:1709846-Prymnesium_polylepis.1